LIAGFIPVFAMHKQVIVLIFHQARIEITVQVLQGDTQLDKLLRVLGIRK
jgi:hypothetical protein